MSKRGWIGLAAGATVVLVVVLIIVLSTRDRNGAALERKKQSAPSRKPILDGEKQARLLAIACSQPPEGRARWTLHLLAQAMVRLDIVESISYETVRRALKK